MNIYETTRQDIVNHPNAGIIAQTNGELFYDMAMDMINEISNNNSQGKSTVMIIPVGPVGHYPIFVRLVNKMRISLKNTWFFNMDEYLNDNLTMIDPNSKLSFVGFMDREVYSRIDPSLIMPPEQRIFPTPDNCEIIYPMMEQLGGVDLCIGGLGINGHLAFNEPPETDMDDEEFFNTGTHVQKIAHETRVVNSIGDLSGAIDLMPKYAVTLGMKEILNSRRIRIYTFRDWHRSAVRKALFGPVTSKCPASRLKNHPDATISMTEFVAQNPY
ncbi:MAG: glucosamine-6-phosphate isomerase [Clostridiaceae bacterium]|nr:glucosamine-6-phosphate isomerase [Clostridiaceae bacterium]